MARGILGELSHALTGFLSRGPPSDERVMKVLHSRKLQMLLLAPVTMGWLCGAPLAATTAGSGMFAADAAEQPAPASSSSPAGFWMTEDHAWTV